MGLCLGCAKFVWPMAPELPMAELEQRPRQHEAGLLAGCAAARAVPGRALRAKCVGKVQEFL